VLLVAFTSALQLRLGCLGCTGTAIEPADLGQFCKICQACNIYLYQEGQEGKRECEARCYLSNKTRVLRDATGLQKVLNLGS